MTNTFLQLFNVYSQTSLLPFKYLKHTRKHSEALRRKAKNSDFLQFNFPPYIDVWGLHAGMGP
jgi:hypothetical protein